MSLLPGLALAADRDGRVVLQRMVRHQADAGRVAEALADVEAAGGVNGPELLAPTAWGASEGELWASWPMVDGIPLTTLLQRCVEEGTALPVGVAGRILLDAAGGLAVLHRLVDAQGNVTPMAHGGPGLDSFWVGSDGVTYLADTGLARARARLLEPTRDVNLGADVLALGHVMYTVLTARPVPPGTPGPLDVRLVQPNVPASVANVVQRATHPNAGLRPSNAMVLVVGLENALKPVGGAGSHADVTTLVEGLFPAHHALRVRMADALRPYGGAAQERPAPQVTSAMAAMPAGTASGRAMTMQQILGLGLPEDSADISSVNLQAVGSGSFTSMSGTSPGAVDVSLTGLSPVETTARSAVFDTPRDISGLQPAKARTRTEVQYAAAAPPAAPPREEPAPAWKPQSLSSLAANDEVTRPVADMPPRRRSTEMQTPVAFNIDVDRSMPPEPSASLPPVQEPRSLPAPSDPVPGASMPWGALPAEPPAPSEASQRADEEPPSAAAPVLPPPHLTEPSATDVVRQRAPSTAKATGAAKTTKGGKTGMVAAGVLVLLGAGGVAAWQFMGSGGDAPSAAPAVVADAAPKADPLPAATGDKPSEATQPAATGETVVPDAAVVAVAAEAPKEAAAQGGAQEGADAGVAVAEKEAAAPEAPARETARERKARLAREKAEKRAALKEAKLKAAEEKKAARAAAAAAKRAKTHGTVMVEGPDGAVVTVDGKKAGVLPLKKVLEVKKGRHVVRVTHRKSKLDKKLKVNVVAGKEHAVTVP